jgi:hypothetical protein
MQRGCLKLSKIRRPVVAHLILGFLLCFLAFAQEQPNDIDPASQPGRPHLGFPQDWSAPHLVMTGHNASAVLGAARGEPRHVYNMVQRMIATEGPRRTMSGKKTPIKVDWAVSLENGFVAATQFPAKYRFDFSSQSCNGDYVVYALTVNSGTQANLVGINNLYTEASPKCNGGVPWVAFAYNTVTRTGGQNRINPFRGRYQSRLRGERVLGVLLPCARASQSHTNSADADRNRTGAAGAEFMRHANHGQLHDHRPNFGCGQYYLFALDRLRERYGIRRHG